VFAPFDYNGQIGSRKVQVWFYMGSYYSHNYKER